MHMVRTFRGGRALRAAAALAGGLSLVMTALTTAGTATAQAAPAATARGSRLSPPSPSRDWSLTFDSEFRGDSLNTKQWSTGWLSSGITPPVNSYELECYDPNQVKVSGGQLLLSVVSKQETCGGQARPYASGLVNTNGKYSFTYGWMEARIWLPGTTGRNSAIANWPAFWADGQSWPFDGETDVLEGLGGVACAHFNNPAGAPGECSTKPFAGGWHTYAANWEPGSLTFYYDGHEVWKDTSGITSAPMYLILNLAVFPEIGGPTKVPSTMRVDWVRVWQHPGRTTQTSVTAKPAAPSPGQETTLTATIAPTPIAYPTSTGGTVTFADAGRAIPGCSAVPISSGRATCSASFSTKGAHRLSATYTGMAGFKGSTGSLTLTVPRTVPHVFVTNNWTNAVTEYATGASGDAKPVTTISGPHTGLNGPQGLAVNSAGNVFVANFANFADSVTEYAKGAAGDAKPIATISGPHTGLNGPQGLAIDSAGNLFVTNYLGNSVTEYAKGASGDAKPIATISGPHTGLNGPQGLAVDSAGNLFVASYFDLRSRVTEYVKGAAGNVKPIATISGSHTGLNGPQGLTVDSAGNLLVANQYGSSLTEYAKGAAGNVKPIATISGPRTGLSHAGPYGLDVDSTGHIFVADFFTGPVTEYAKGAAGNVKPIATISGSRTQLNGPTYVAVAH